MKPEIQKIYNEKLTTAAEAVKMIASERKMNKLDLIVHDACIKGEDLYIDGYIPGTKKAHAITKREGERWTKRKSH